MKSILVLLSTTTYLLAQGPLTPPAGPPAPTMKTLAEIANLVSDASTEAGNARFFAQKAQQAVANHTLITSNTGTYTITEPGTYTVTADRVAPSGAASIRVQASDVIIDLNGFSITPTNTTSVGIFTDSNIHGLTVRNGTIIGCNQAISSELTGCDRLRVEKVTALDCTGAVFAGNDNCLFSDCVIRGVAGTTTAIDCSANSVVRNTQITLVAGRGIQGTNGAVAVTDCSVTGGDSFGISLGGVGSSINRSIVTSNTSGGIWCSASSSSILHTMVHGCGGYGIQVGSNSRIESCVASQNTSSGTSSGGMLAGANSLVIGCTASGNLNTHAAPDQSKGAGIVLSGPGCIASGCTAGANTGAGIVANVDNCTVRDNHASGNGTGTGVGAGIYVAGSRNRIEGNYTSDNKTGFLVRLGASKNILVRNTAGNNATNNWNIPTNNFVAPVVAAAATPAFTGNTGGTALGSTDPNANFTLP